MRYWVYSNNEVRGPFGPRELSSSPGFTGSSLVCPESDDGGQAAGWKEASNYPEIFSAPPAPPAQAAAAAAAPRPAPAEDLLALTMRGSLVSEPVMEPRAGHAEGPSKVSELVFAAPRKPDAAPGAAPAGAAGPNPADPRIEALKKKLDQMSSALKAMGESQVQLTGRIGMLESAIADMQSLLAQELPEK